MHWQQITLVGVGLLGGSLGLAARKRRLASRVIGFVRRQASVAECEQAGACAEVPAPRDGERCEGGDREGGDPQGGPNGGA